MPFLPLAGFLADESLLFSIHHARPCFQGYQVGAVLLMVEDKQRDPEKQ
jgi:hypothetical protein